MINLIRNQTFGREDGPVTESEKKRLAIAAAMKALLRSNPIEKITTEQILEQSGVSRRSFYRYFKDKYDLLQWIYNYDFCRFVEVRPEKSIWEYYPDILRSLRADPEFYSSAFVYAGQNSFRAFCFEKLFPLIMTDFGDIFPDAETARFVIRRYVYAFFDGYIWWLKKKDPMPWEEFEALSKSVTRATAQAILASFDKSDAFRAEET